MVYRFTIISDEVDNFLREICIDSEATFFELHELILESTGYSTDLMTSFFTCDDGWEKEVEITLEQMDNSPEYDSWMMRETKLSEFLDDEKQRLLYLFDYMTERYLFMELTEIITGKELKKAKCTVTKGEAPAQTIEFEEVKISKDNFDLDENFYGDESYDLEEFENEGFDELDAAADTPSENDFF